MDSAGMKAELDEHKTQLVKLEEENDKQKDKIASHVETIESQASKIDQIRADLQKFEQRWMNILDGKIVSSNLEESNQQIETSMGPKEENALLKRHREDEEGDNYGSKHQKVDEEDDGDVTFYSGMVEVVGQEMLNFLRDELGKSDETDEVSEQEMNEVPPKEKTKAVIFYRSGVCVNCKIKRIQTVVIESLKHLEHILECAQKIHIYSCSSFLSELKGTTDEEAEENYQAFRTFFAKIPVKPVDFYFDNWKSAQNYEQAMAMFPPTFSFNVTVKHLCELNYLNLTLFNKVKCDGKLRICELTEIIDRHPKFNILTLTGYMFKDIPIEQISQKWSKHELDFEKLKVMVFDDKTVVPSTTHQRSDGKELKIYQEYSSLYFIVSTV